MSSAEREEILEIAAVRRHRIFRKAPFESGMTEKAVQEVFHIGGCRNGTRFGKRPRARAFFMRAAGAASFRLDFRKDRTTKATYRGRAK